MATDTKLRYTPAEMIEDLGVPPLSRGRVLRGFASLRASHLATSPADARF
jgi:hypothetical protein